MNANECKGNCAHETPAGGLSRRRCLTLCAGLFGALGLAPRLWAGRSRGPAAGGQAAALAAGPRERPLREADFYHPHDLAG